MDEKNALFRAFLPISYRVHPFGAEPTKTPSMAPKSVRMGASSKRLGRQMRQMQQQLSLLKLNTFDEVSSSDQGGRKRNLPDCQGIIKTHQPG